MLTDKELKVAKQRYNKHSRNCCDRIDRAGNPIEFRLTFDQWIDIWLSSSHWHERGKKRGQYVMSRFNDTGHYEIGNVEIKSVKENIIEKTNSTKWQKKHKLAMQNKSNEWREKQKLAVQKANSKQISCDGVIFESQKTAALALAPETSVSINAKVCWLIYQMIKFPERYFYVTKSE